MSDSPPPESSSRRGVWGFVKRNVWGDAQSHPVSVSRSASPEETVPEHATLQQGARGDVGQSPFRSRARESSSDKDLRAWSGDEPSQASSVTMVSEPSLRHGLAEGMQTLNSWP